MLLFEESDLDSALDCLIESSFRFNGMVISLNSKALKKIEFFNLKI